MKSEVNKQELFYRYSTFKSLKLFFPGTALSFDVFKKCFGFPGNLPPLNLFILRTRAAFDRCGGARLSEGGGKRRDPGNEVVHLTVFT